MKSIFLFIFFLFCQFFVCSNISAATVRTRIDEQTLIKGFTFYSADNNFKVGVRSNSLSKRKKVNFSIKQIDPANYNLTDENLVSNLYSFDIHSKNPIKIKKAIWLNLKYYTQQDGYEQVMKFWDSNLQTWRELPTTDKKKKMKVQSAITLPFATIGVFAKEINYQIGYASWYDYSGAASTFFPYGSIVKVINLSNNKSCTVTINDYGPFVENRVIDLPRKKFAKIADLGAGIVKVKVIPIYIP